MTEEQKWEVKIGKVSRGSTTFEICRNGHPVLYVGVSKAVGVRATMMADLCGLVKDVRFRRFIREANCIGVDKR